MLQIDGWLSAFSRLSSQDRERSGQLLRAYNEALAESQHSGAVTLEPFRLFTPREIEGLIKDYRAGRLSRTFPAMERYLRLLDRGYKWPFPA
jgi:hypothetical protein